MNNVTNILQTLLAHPILGPILPVAGAAIPMTLFLAYAGLNFMVFALQVTGVRTKRSAYDKAARQMASLALILGWLLLVVSRVYLFVSSDGYVPQSLLAAIVELSWGLFGFAVIASSVHFAVWRFLANHRGWHSLLAFLAGLNSLASIFAILGSLRMLVALELPNADQLSLGMLFNYTVFPSPLYYAAVLAIPLAMAVPAAAGIIWLVIRRKKDDFGRDYYNTITRFVARWGAMAWLPVIVLLGGVVYFELKPLLDSGTEITPMTWALLGSRVVPAFLSWICLLCVSRAALPMRFKPLAFLAFLLSMPAAYYVFEDATTFVF
ncbi:MAG: hypothetical protein Q4F72_04580 [Desulfovibrionaceae bacterium]|nr:hypothetical protein [Desulfovibrionaceae bacterium]